LLQLAIRWGSALKQELCERKDLATGLGKEAEERVREEERNRQALELALWAHLESNFLGLEYQKDYTASYVPRILHHDSREWLQEYKEVIGVILREVIPHHPPYQTEASR
jgi:hypothetical protein